MSEYTDFAIVSPAASPSSASRACKYAMRATRSCQKARLEPKAIKAGAGAEKPFLSTRQIELEVK